MTTKHKQPATSPAQAQAVPDLSKALQQPGHSVVPAILELFNNRKELTVTLGNGEVIFVSHEDGGLNITMCRYGGGATRVQLNNEQVKQLKSML